MDYIFMEVHKMIKFNQNASLKPYIDLNTMEKRWKMSDNIEKLNLSQQKEEGIIFYQNQIIMLQSFLQKIC